MSVHNIFIIAMQIICTVLFLKLIFHGYQNNTWYLLKSNINAKNCHILLNINSIYAIQRYTAIIYIFDEYIADETDWLTLVFYIRYIMIYVLFTVNWRK